MSIIKILFGKKKEATTDDLKAAVLKKATEHMNATSESADSSDNLVKKDMPTYQTNDKVKKKNIRAVLLELAEGGDTGVLPVSVADKTGINQQDTVTALAFLTKEHYAEEVNSATGFKYYLTDTGRKFCISKEFNSEY